MLVLLQDSKTGSSHTSSPFGSRESLQSVGKDGHLTPTKHANSRSNSLASSVRREDGEDSGIADIGESVDEDMMHKMVTNKALMANRRSLQLGESNLALFIVSVLLFD